MIIYCRHSVQMYFCLLVFIAVYSMRELTIFISYRAVLRLLPPLDCVHVFHLTLFCFCAVHLYISWAFRLSLHLVTSYYISGALWTQLQRGLWTTFFALVLWSVIMSFLALFSTSLFFSHCCLGCGCLTQSCICLLTQPGLPTLHISREIKGSWEQCQGLSTVLLLFSCYCLCCHLHVSTFISSFWYPHLGGSFLSYGMGVAELSPAGLTLLSHWLPI